MTNAIVLKLDAAIRTVNELSRDAKSADDMETMYAANRAWKTLTDRRKRITLRLARQ